MILNSRSDRYSKRGTSDKEEQCAHRHRFETLTHAMHTIDDWIRPYNRQRPHHALEMPPAEACALAARPVQEVAGHYRRRYDRMQK
ncbi:integrase core domain-containing protein [Luteibacter sp. 22Crub2.1]|uniref:integrase core domain-containing protein n=1 Tax=Luteibacter sp. 22Crub2.1 TaxID=1283288 RepID=UPI0009A6397F|nr:integrase core domain-containing protein [Luteibacter sp. 22Crub2.1]